MIYVGWLGDGSEPQTLLRDVVWHVGREFATPARRWRSEPLPRHAFDARRGQYSSRELLAWIAGRLPEDDGKVLAITDVDLFIPVLTFVFGEAQLGGRTAIVSMWRLQAAATVVRARLLKETVHELGHTFGLVHCATPACVMARSPAVAAVDAKTERLCGDCRVRYGERLKERAYAATNSENPDRR